MARAQEKVIANLPEGTQWYRVNFSRPAYFKRRFKLRPFEARAVITVTAHEWRVQGEDLNGEVIDVVFPRETTRLQWLGDMTIKSGNLHWFTVGEGEHQVYLSADTGMIALHSRRASADIVRQIAPQLDLPSLATQEFAIEKNLASLAVVVLFFAFAMFALFDGMILNRYELLTYTLVKVGVALGVVIGFAAYFWMLRKKVPHRESLAIALLFCASLQIANIPVMKRLDQVLDKTGPKIYRYRLEENTRLRALDPGPPPLNFRRHPEYWRQFEIGSTHEFILTHGPLGLWQVDLAPLDQKYRDFYRKQKE